MQNVGLVHDTAAVVVDTGGEAKAEPGTAGTARADAIPAAVIATTVVAATAHRTSLLIIKPRYFSAVRHSRLAERAPSAHLVDAGWSGRVDVYGGRILPPPLPEWPPPPLPPPPLPPPPPDEHSETERFTAVPLLTTAPPLGS